MNTWTLQFSDKSLEEDFFQQVIPGLLKYFQWLSITLIVLSFGFSTYLFILGHQIEGTICGSLFLAFILTQQIIRKYNNLINVGFFIYNVLLFLLQIIYLIHPYYLNSGQQAYLLGICEAYLSIAFLLGTNFGYKLTILGFLFFEKIILSVVGIGFFEVQIIIVFAVLFLSIACYWTDKTRRDFFLSQYANSQFNEIIDREVKSNIIMCAIDYENVKIRFQKANKAAKRNLKICDDFLLTGYLRQIQMNNITLEEWLFKMYSKGLLKNTVIKTDDAEITIRVFDKLNHQILLFIDNFEYLTKQLKLTKNNLQKMETQHLRYIVFTANSMEKLSCLTQKLKQKTNQTIQQQLSTILIQNTNVIYNHLYMGQQPKLTSIQRFNLLIFLRQFLQICNLLARSSQSTVRLYYPTSCDLMITSNIKYLSHILLNQMRNAIYVTKKSTITLKVQLQHIDTHPTCEFELDASLASKNKQNIHYQRNKVTKKLLKLIGPSEKIEYLRVGSHIKISFNVYTDLKHVVSSLQ